MILFRSREALVFGHLLRTKYVSSAATNTKRLFLSACGIGKELSSDPGSLKNEKHRHRRDISGR